MKVQLTPEWRIVDDKLNYVLQSKQKLKDPKKGRKGDGWWIRGYYPKLSQALESFVARYVRATDVSSLKEVQYTLLELKRLISSIKGSK